MHRTRRMLLAAVAGAALLGGCGGDSDEQGTEGSPPEVDTQRPSPAAPVGPEDEVRTDGDGG